MTKNVNSELFSLKSIIASAYQFNIPRYQRLFVWKREQVATLLNDIGHACDDDKDLYYLGGVLLVKNKKQQYDLIDGQQRFTTLWLLCHVLGGALTEFTRINGESRLKFAIRKEVSAYFEGELNIGNRNIDDQREGGSLAKIVEAKAIIQEFLTDKYLGDPESLGKFSSFVMNKVQVIISKVPPTTDLNKLFEVINNRGLQLQHHEILKSRILSKIVSSKKERIRYGKVWNACAGMNNYIERNLNKESGRNVAYQYHQWKGAFDFEAILKLMDEADTLVKPMTLSVIMDHKNLKDAGVLEKNDVEEHPDTTEDEHEAVRSILSFAQLLQHVLRIYQYKKKDVDIKRINEKELLQSFGDFLDNLSEHSAKQFIKILFEVRVVFDKFIIKWVTVEPNVEHHLIKNLKYQNRVKGSPYYYLRREKTTAIDEFAFLQSMLYHSQQITTQHWLTPLLVKMLASNDRGELFRYLMQLDNNLFCTGDKDELLNRTWKYMGREFSPVTGTSNINQLRKPEGTSFWHYWFYKLEFVLWYSKKDERPGWKDFRLTSKNSIEHVSPQNQKDTDRNVVSADHLDTFGNLALVSRSLNSELGNNEFLVKQQQFLAKKNANRLESLKLDLIYDSPIWNDKVCETHNDEMIKIMDDYLIKRF